MNHGQLYQFLNYLRRKDAIGDTISGDEYNRIAPIVAYKLFKKYMGLPEQYQKGSRDAVFGLGLNAISEEKIKPLKTLPVGLTLNTLPPVAPGTLSIDVYASYPADYFRHGSLFYLYINGSTSRTIQIPVVNDSKFNERRVTTLDPPSLIDPVANLQAEYIRFAPAGLAGQVIYLEYVKLPTEPVMGYVVNSDTGELIYVDHGAYCQILTPGTVGNVITLTVGAVTLGSYTVVSGDTAEDVMLGLRDDINTETLTHNVTAVYDGTKIVLIDAGETYTTLTASPTGIITLNKANFTSWSTQFDWENDIESMNEIAELMLDMMGISNRDMNLVQWAEKEKANG